MRAVEMIASVSQISPVREQRKNMPVYCNVNEGGDVVENAKSNSLFAF